MTSKSLFISLVLAFASGGTWADGSTQTQQICSNVAVPSGYAVIQRSTTNLCPGQTGNGFLATLMITPFTNPMVVCSESPRPPGWVVTQQQTTNRCYNVGSTTTTNATWSIRTPMSPMQICTVSPVPSGYVVTDILDSNACANSMGGGNTSSYSIKIPVQTSGQTETVCSSSPIPPGYTVIEVLRNQNRCGIYSSAGFQLGTVYVLRRN